MSQALILLAIGFLLVASLVYLLRRREAEADDVSWLQEGNSARPSAPLEDRKKEQVDRIFGREDWDFIRSGTSTRVQRLFLRERKGIALSWLSQLRRQARAGMDFHVTRVRASEELEPLVELRLAIDYYAFLAKCGLIAAIVQVGGPVALRGMAGRAESLSSSLRGILATELESQVSPQKTTMR